MKTEMNYEKKYKEALEWIRSIYPTMQGADKEDAEHYFPELKEGEDERIRKELIQYLKDYPNLPNGIFCRNDFFAWLEKQGEKKPAWSEEDERILNKIQDNLREFYVDKKGYPYVAEPDSPEVMEKNWLQSFKDRVQPNHWKPSEEHLRVLQTAIKDYGICVEKKIFSNHFITPLKNLNRVEKNNRNNIYKVI